MPLTNETVCDVMLELEAQRQPEATKLKMEWVALLKEGSVS